MKIYIKYIALLIVGLFSIYIIFKKPESRIYKIEVIKPTQKNILLEDFNDKLNDKYWDIVEKGNNYNNELQYYALENVTIDNSLLNIGARKENKENYNYTSGMITTKNKFAFLYGKIIFKAKPAVGQGLLSAIWLLPADDSLYPEVDILEILGENSKKMWTGIHYLDSSNNYQKYFVSHLENGDFATYEFDWNKNEIKCYINNKLVFRRTTDVPNKKMYLNINLSVGGDWPKEPIDKAFPSSFLIDYIMVIPEVIEEL